MGKPSWDGLVHNQACITDPLGRICEVTIKNSLKAIRRGVNCKTSSENNGKTLIDSIGSRHKVRMHRKAESIYPGPATQNPPP